MWGKSTLCVESSERILRRSTSSAKSTRSSEMDLWRHLRQPCFNYLTISSNSQSFDLCRFYLRHNLLRRLYTTSHLPSRSWTSCSLGGPNPLRLSWESHALTFCQSFALSFAGAYPRLVTTVEIGTDMLRKCSPQSMPGS